MRLAELRDLCVDRGLDSNGNKSQLLQRLREDDFDKDNGAIGTDNTSNENQLDSHDDSEDAEVTLVTTKTSGEVTNITANNDFTNLRALELQLALEQTRLERVRLECNPRGSVGDVAHVRDLHASLPNMSESGDVLAFFSCFEKTLKLNDVHESSFHKYLPAHLNERCKKIFARLSYEQCVDYQFLKSELVSTARASPKAYLAKFRSATRTGSETQKMFVGRLAEALDYWLQSQSISTFEGLKDAVLLEQFLGTLSPTTRQFVETRGARKANEAAEAADLYFETTRQPKQLPNRYMNRTSNGENSSKTNTDGAQQYQKPNVGVGDGERQPNKNFGSGGVASMQETHPKKFLRGGCFTCGGPHRAFECPNRHQGSTQQMHRQNIVQSKANVALTSRQSANHFRDVSGEYIIPIFVNGVETTAYRDTGAECVLVDSNLVRDAVITGSWSISGINDEKPREIPTTMVTLSSPHFSRAVLVEAGLIKNLKWNILLGNEFFRQNKVADIISVNKGIHLSTDIMKGVDEKAGSHLTSIADGMTDNTPDISKVEGPLNQLADQTRRNLAGNSQLMTANVYQTRQQNVAERGVLTSVNDLGTKCRVVHPTPENNDTLCGSMAEMDECAEREIEDRALTDGRDLTVYKDLSVRADSACKMHVTNHIMDNSNESNSLKGQLSDTVTVEFHRLAAVDDHTSAIQDVGQRSTLIADQRGDDSLKHWLSLATDGSREFVLRDGVLFRRTPPAVHTEHEYLLCLPTSCRRRVLIAAHDSDESGGHFGFRRTLYKIGNAGMTWPKCSVEVRRYCETCDVCARKSPRQQEAKLKQMSLHT
jgi:hypothetical protein